MTSLIASILALIPVLVTVFVLWRRSEKIPAQEDAQLSWAASFALVALAVAARLVLVLWLKRSGFVMLTHDEAHRWYIGQMWAEEPFFFPRWGWLTGNFAFFGTLIRIFGPGLMSLQIGVVLGHVLNIGAAYYVGRVLSDRRWTGVMAAWFVAAGFPFVWSGAGPLVEVPLSGFFMLAVACFARFVSLGGSSPLFRLALSSCAAVCLLGVVSLHYTGWMAIAVVAVFAMPRSGRIEKAIGAAGWTGIGLMVLGCTAVPAAWFLHSWKVSGDPLEFLASQQTNNWKYMEQTGYSTEPLPMLALYPKLFLLGCGALLPLAILLFRASTGTPIARRAAGFVCTLLLAMSVSTLGSGHSTSPVRNIIIPYSCSLVLLAILGRPLEFRSGEAGHRRVSRSALIALMVIGWFGYNIAIARQYEAYNRDRVPADFVKLSAWVKHRIGEADDADSFQSGKIGLHPKQSDWGNNWLVVLQYLSGESKRIAQLSEWAWVTGRIDDYDVLIFSGRGPPDLKAFELIHREGQWKVYARK